MIDLSSIIIAISLIIGCTGLCIAVWSIYQTKELAKKVGMTSIPINENKGVKVYYTVGGKPLGNGGGGYAGSDSGAGDIHD